MNRSLHADEAKTNSEIAVAGKYKPLRVWPAILLLVAMAAAKIFPKFVEDESMAILMATILGPLLLGVLILIWWLTFSRATAGERIVGFLGTVITGIVVAIVMDPTMMGPGLILLGIPLATAAFGIAAVSFGRFLSFKRTLLAVLAAAVGFSYIACLRNDGMWGNGQLGLNWRWEKSPEEVMLAERSAKSADPATITDEQFESWLEQPQWPQFRGPANNSQQFGPIVASDWSDKKPELIWKIAVGPGWASFAVAGNLLFTQEQHGEKETVVCYAADTGDEVWKQQINERFFDALGGPGPRGTPTLANGMLFAQSANGLVQRLDPRTGTVVWSKDIKEVADRQPPAWGFSSSPLVVGNNVIVHAGGAKEKGILAFDIENGDLNWTSKAGDHSYSSPQLAKVGNREGVLMLTNAGLNIVDPKTGSLWLDYPWQHSGYRAIQPQVIDGNSILLPTQEIGTRRIEVTESPGDSSQEFKFVATEKWTSRHLKPDFNDFVVFDNNAYGFDGRFFTCVDLETGTRRWRRGRYGKGQVLLLAESGLLLVVSESGELVLLKADPASHQELAKFQALEGRTWNHPVVIGDRLYVRNSQEAACFRLPLDKE